MQRFEFPLPAAAHDDNCWQCPEMFFGTNRNVKARCRRLFRRVTVDTLDELSITKSPTQSLYRPARPIIVSESVAHSCAKLEAWKLCYLWESVILEWSDRPDRRELCFRLFKLLSRELWFCVAMMSKDLPIPPWADLGSWSSFDSLRRSAAKAIVDWLPEIYRIAHLIINIEPEITSMMWKVPGFRFTWSDGLLGLLSDIGHHVQIQVDKEDETWDLFAELCRSGMIRIEKGRCLLAV